MEEEFESEGFCDGEKVSESEKQFGEICCQGFWLLRLDTSNSFNFSNASMGV